MIHVFSPLSDFNAHYDVNDKSFSSDFGVSLYRWMECNNLFQFIKEPTRVTANGDTILDLIVFKYSRLFCCVRHS